MKNNKAYVMTCLFAFFMLLAGGCALFGVDSKKIEEYKQTRAIIETKLGEIEIKFFPDEAPGHVENFIELAKKGMYNGTLFHRIVPGFMIQGGDPNTMGSDTKAYGQGGPGYTIPAEFNAISHNRGIVSMARSKDIDSAGSQFFIMVDNKPQLDGQYTVFGEVVRGMDVVDAIAELPRNLKEMPLERVTMKVKIMSPPKAPAKK